MSFLIEGNRFRKRTHWERVTWGCLCFYGIEYWIMAKQTSHVIAFLLWTVLQTQFFSYTHASTLFIPQAATLTFQRSSSTFYISVFSTKCICVSVHILPEVKLTVFICTLWLITSVCLSRKTGQWGIPLPVLEQKWSFPLSPPMKSFPCLFSLHGQPVCCNCYCWGTGESTVTEACTEDTHEKYTL